MICRVTGRLVAIAGESVVLEQQGIAYEVLVSATVLGELQQRIGTDVTLHTIHYYEGNPAGSHLTPRLIGFLAEADRAFFGAFTRVKGISYRKALRAMSVPVQHLAAAIAQGDVRTLTSLPEIGKKTATQIVAELQNEVEAFLDVATAGPVTKPLSDVQQVAVEILVQWGDRRADVERWVSAAVEEHPELSEPDAIVRAAYRFKELRI